MVNRAQLRMEVLDRLGDTTQSIWTAGEIDQYLQGGYDLLAAQTGVLWDRTYLSIKVGVALYVMPESLIEIERATYDDRRLEPLSIKELMARDSRFDIVTGQIDYYTCDEAPRTIRIYRLPAHNAFGANDVRIEFRRRGAPLTDDASTFEIPDWMTKTVRFYAMWKALKREGTGQDLDLAKHYENRWLDGTKRIARRVSRVMAAKTLVMGEARPGMKRPPRPQLPWNYGKRVRG